MKGCHRCCDHFHSLYIRLDLAERISKTHFLNTRQFLQSLDTKPDRCLFLPKRIFREPPFLQCTLIDDHTPEHDETECDDCRT
ncbi:hypothetical protein ACFLZO_00890 [Patescibacteria group bacterium]